MLSGAVSETTKLFKEAIVALNGDDDTGSIGLLQALKNQASSPS